MNKRMVFNIIRKLMLVEGILLLLPMLVAVIYREGSWTSFAMVAAGLILLGGIGFHKQPADQNIYAKDGLMIVGLAWVFWSLCGALPFVISGAIPNYIDAVFETASGFTTTGSSILTEIQTLPKGILFWRSFTHWIGGMGVLVFVMAILPLAKERNMYIMKAEVPGPTVGKLVPKANETAKILYALYIGLTLLEAALLMFGGMSFYNAICHSMATAGTGGFSTLNASIGGFHSPYIEWVCTVFMILFGVNFNLYYLIFLRRFKPVFKNEELRVYLLIFLVLTGIIAVNINGLYDDFGTSVRQSGFTVASIMSTTGFVSTDYLQWPLFSQHLLLILMFCGACAGSTGGGLKIVRLILIGKLVKRDLRKIARPRLVSSIRVDGAVVDEDTLKGIYTYLMVFVVILAFSTAIVALDGYDITTTFSGVVTCINNVGPAMGVLNGPSGNFYAFSPLAKIVLTIDMLVGRLEIFPMLMLFMPSLWRKKTL